MNIATQIEIDIDNLKEIKGVVMAATNGYKPYLETLDEVIYKMQEFGVMQERQKGRPTENAY